MILYIDTHHGDTSTLATANRAGLVVRQRVLHHDRDQSVQLLPAIEALLRSSKLKLTDITGIGVVQGEGGFTALRLGISTANALAYALHIPVVGIMHRETERLETRLQKIARSLKTTRGKLRLVMPKYGRSPNITHPKK
ncbi:MAG: tRNA (adenosine(37)-N6)-threonylcarbamoyltransferase complex dimerization subunit type 1 TsaB [Candidatus Kerfeldbacteria bacterium]|nr:tRNA (adenosine(37)-N6)-threonylcarbamoyltransferase complex dimerization subunit type 1 TsaB [Candidatus Kerfeldbacteria bacterium]